MNQYTVAAVVALLVTLIVLTEIAAAVLPIIIVVAFVPPQDRDTLARVVAACDSTHKLRIWSALRLAVKARRQERRGSRGAGHDLQRAVDTQS